MLRTRRRFLVEAAAGTALGCRPAWAAPEPSSPGPDARPVDVYLYRNPSLVTAKLFDEGEYDDRLAHWSTYLDAREMPWRETARAELAAGLAPGVLILPSAIQIDAIEQQALLDHLRKGGSIWATGPFGQVDESGRALGDSALKATFGASIAGYFGAGPEWFLQPFGDGPLTWKLPAAKRIDVGQVKPRTIPRLVAPQLAAVMDSWSREKENDPIGAITYDEPGAGRCVYYAFPESTWDVAQPDDIKALLDGTLDWLRRTPRAYKAAWPNGKTAAHLIEMDTEDKFFSATTLADHLESIGVRGTFYCVTTEAVKYPKVVPELMRRGHEIAYHADVHYGFKLEPIREQDLRIQFMLAQMKTLMGDRVREATGFRAPTESYDLNTERVLRRNGLRHHAADPDASESRLPLFSRAEPRLDTDLALVVLPRTQMDDVDFAGHSYTPDQVLEILIYDLNLTMAEGAFGLLSVHSQNYVPGGLMQRTVGRYVEYVARFLDRLWVAPGGEIAAWWRERAKVEVRSQASADTSLELSLQTVRPIQGLAVYLALPRRSAKTSISASDPGAPAPRFVPLDAYRTALIFDVAMAGTYRYQIRFEPS